MDLESPTSLNFIRLGAVVQKQFGMKENYRVEIFPPDSENQVRLVVPPPPEERSRFPSPIAQSLVIDMVEMHLFGSTDNFYVRAGYSAKANVLCVSEVLNL